MAIIGPNIPSDGSTTLPNAQLSEKKADSATEISSPPNTDYDAANISNEAILFGSGETPTATHFSPVEGNPVDPPPPVDPDNLPFVVKHGPDSTTGPLIQYYPNGEQFPGYNLSGNFNNVTLNLKADSRDDQFHLEDASIHNSTVNISDNTPFDSSFVNNTNDNVWLNASKSSDTTYNIDGVEFVNIQELDESALATLNPVEVQDLPDMLPHDYPRYYIDTPAGSPTTFTDSNGNTYNLSNGNQINVLDANGDLVAVYFLGPNAVDINVPFPSPPDENSQNA